MYAPIWISVISSIHANAICFRGWCPTFAWKSGVLCV